MRLSGNCACTKIALLVELEKQMHYSAQQRNCWPEMRASAHSFRQGSEDLSPPWGGGRERRNGNGLSAQRANMLLPALEGARRCVSPACIGCSTRSARHIFFARIVFPRTPPPTTQLCA